jgi:hypothetical protein
MRLAQLSADYRITNILRSIAADDTETTAEIQTRNAGPVSKPAQFTSQLFADQGFPEKPSWGLRLNMLSN